MPAIPHDIIKAFSTLGIPPTDDKAAIKSAFRKLAKDLHPDHHRDEEANRQAHAAFKELVSAKEIVFSAISDGRIPPGTGGAPPTSTLRTPHDQRGGSEESVVHPPKADPIVDDDDDDDWDPWDDRPKTPPPTQPGRMHVWLDRVHGEPDPRAEAKAAKRRAESEARWKREQEEEELILSGKKSFIVEVLSEPPEDDW